MLTAEFGGLISKEKLKCMIVLVIEVIIGVAAYYFIRKKLTEKFNAEFVKSIKWMVIEPILLVFASGTALWNSVTTFGRFSTFLFVNETSKLGLSDSLYSLDAAIQIDSIKESIRNSVHFDTLGISAMISSIVGVIGLILFITMIVRLTRGFFVTGNKRVIKKAHDVVLATFIIIPLFTMWYRFTFAKCIENIDVSSGIYIALFVDIAFYIGLLYYLRSSRKKFITSIDTFFSSKEQNVISQTTETVSNKPSREDNSKAKQLLELKELLDKGLLTQEEFDEEKRKILNA